MNNKATPQKIKRDNENGFWFIVFDLITLAIEILIYFISILGPIYFLWLQRQLSITLLVFLGVISWYATGVIFICIIVIVKRLFIGHIPFGKYLLTDINNKNGLKWIFAERLVKIMNRSPFANLVSSNFIYRNVFYKGLGAKINSTLIMGRHSSIEEPWGFTAGKNLILGLQVAVSGHKVEKNTLTLGPVTIGNNVTVGARSIIFPHVEIGNNVVIGAGSVVVQGTQIPDGEKWSGNPAKKINSLMGF